MLQKKQPLKVSFPRNADVYFYANPCPHLLLPLEGWHGRVDRNKQSSHLLTTYYKLSIMLRAGCLCVDFTLQTAL